MQMILGVAMTEKESNRRVSVLNQDFLPKSYLGK